LNKRLFFLLIIASFKLQAETCLLKGQIRYLQNQKQITEKSSYCYDSKEKTILSFSCQHKKCNAMEFKIVYRKYENDDTGSPGFKICQRHYHAMPQIIEFWDEKKWVKTSRCIFPDGSFIDTGRLMQNSG